jgi:hypothetical protein
MESEVQAVLERLLATNQLTSADQVKATVKPSRTEVPELAAPEVDLHSYDGLLEAAS